MGYRYYFMEIDKVVVKEIEDMTIKELENHISTTSGFDYISPLTLPMKEVYEMGKHIEFEKEIKKTGKSLFNDKRTREELAEYIMWDVGKSGLLKLIEVYNGFVIDYYKSLLIDDDESDISIYRPMKSVDKQRKHTEDTLDHWEHGFAFNVSEKRDELTHSWKYEYSLFELVRLLKTFDFEKKTLIFCGW